MASLDEFKTPFEALYGTAPPLHHLRCFGCIVYRHIPNAKRKGKFTNRARPCMFRGYVHKTTKVYQILDFTGSGRALESSNVRFLEHKNAWTSRAEHEHESRDPDEDAFPENNEGESSRDGESESPPRSSDELPASERDNLKRSSGELPASERDILPWSFEELPASVDVPVSNTRRTYKTLKEQPPRDGELSNPSVQDSGRWGGERRNSSSFSYPLLLRSPACCTYTRLIQELVTHLSRGGQSVERWNDNSIAITVANHHRGFPQGKFETALIVDLELLSLDEATSNLQTCHPDRDPLSYQEAMSGPDEAKWKVATIEEWKAIHHNYTFQSFQDSETNSEMELKLPIEAPSNVKVIGSKWVYRKKINPDGSTRYKVQLAIRGCEQVAGMDFEDTFAPVSKLTNFRLLMSLAARNNWRVDHMDVVTSFHNPKIDREAVFMSLPLGMSWVNPEMHNRGVRTVRLKKALYGLRKAPKLRFDEINGFRIHLGFAASPADPNLYTRGSIIILLYVDDILIIDTQLNSIQGNVVKDLLCAKYKMSNLGTTRRFLGIEIENTANGITLCLTGYINTILKRFRLEATHDAKSSMDPNVLLDNTACGDKQVDKNLYLSIVWSLMYAALDTCPDISFCVTALSRSNSTPLQMHLTAAKRVLRYLKHTMNHQIHYLQAQTVPLTGFTDSGWAGRTATRKSVGGCIFF